MERPNNRIAIVDDDPDHLLISKMLLESNGYDVLPLTNSQKLVEQISSYQPTMIFMDHTMPFMDGISTTKLIRKDIHCKHIPVIYFTVVDNIEHLAALAGADDYLSKPFRIEEMLNKVRKYC